MKQSYSIRELENLSGIKAHTIRIWEKRYGLLTPERTTTNIRRYTNEDLKKILKIAALILQGHKVSSITQLSDDELDEVMVQQIKQEDSPELAIETARKNLITAFSQFDENAFNHAFSIVLLKYGLVATITKIIYPVLETIGVLWSTGKIMPAQEHFISALVRQKILSATDALPLPTQEKECWLLYLPEGEMHELGLLLANYIIRSSRRRTVYLGQSVPIENVIKTAKATGATHLFLFVVSGKDNKQVTKHLDSLVQHIPQIRKFISGNPTLLHTLITTSSFTILKDVKALQESLTSTSIV